MISIRRNKEFEKAPTYGWVSISCNDVVELAEHVASGSAWSPIVWRDGHRLSSNFIRADFAALDIDGDAKCSGLSIEKCVQLMREKGLEYLIAPTKSSGIEKEVEGLSTPPQDRYRLVLRFATTITDLRVYQYNMKALRNIVPTTDDSTHDGARQFYSSKCVASMGFGSPIEVLAPPVVTGDELRRREAQLRHARAQYEKLRRLPVDLEMFLANGVLLHSSRHRSCLLAGYRLAQLGVPLDDALRLVLKAPFPRGLSRVVHDDEIMRTVRDAYKTVKGENYD